MPRSLVALLIAAAATTASAADVWVKPGLYELKLLNQTINGHDAATEWALQSEKMKAAIANLPAEQRAKLEAALQKSAPNFSANRASQICVSPEMAQRYTTLDAGDNCTMLRHSRSGNTLTFETKCDTGARSTTSKGQAVIAGDTITSKWDAVETGASGAQQTVHAETEMRFLGADCGNVKPFDRPK